MPFDGKSFAPDVIANPKTEIGKVLSLARRYIERGWCKGMLARNAQGSSCNPHADEADSFCLYGAVTRSAGVLAGEDIHSSARLYGAAICELTDLDATPDWNDHDLCTKADVLDVIDRAILSAESVS